MLWCDYTSSSSHLQSSLISVLLGTFSRCPAPLSPSFSLELKKNIGNNLFLCGSRTCFASLQEQMETILTPCPYTLLLNTRVASFGDRALFKYNQHIACPTGSSHSCLKHPLWPASLSQCLLDSFLIPLTSTTWSTPAFSSLFLRSPLISYSATSPSVPGILQRDNMNGSCLLYGPTLRLSYAEASVG